MDTRPDKSNASDPGAQLYKQVLDTLALPIYAISKDYRILFTNAAGRQFPGNANEFDPEAGHCYEILYGRHETCPFCPGNSKEELNRIATSPLEKVIQNRKAGSAEKNYHLRFSSAPEEELLLVETIEDTTAEKEEQEQVLVKENLAALGIMISGIAHELNNPLTGIGLTLQNMLASLQHLTKDQIQSRLQILRKDLHRASRIVSDVLSFSKPGRIRLTRANLYQSVEKAITTTRRLYPVLSRRVDWRLHGDQIVAQVDLEKIERLLINLFRNSIQALDYAPGYIEIKLSDARRHVHIMIEDNAGGIERDKLKKIFQPFFTNSRSGSGLGLTICHSIVKEHNGHIHARTFEDKTRFYISIPREQE